MGILSVIIGGVLAMAVINLLGVFFENATEKNLAGFDKFLAVVVGLFICLFGDGLLNALHIPLWYGIWLLPLAALVGVVAVVAAVTAVIVASLKSHEWTVMAGKWTRRAIEDWRLHRDIEND